MESESPFVRNGWMHHGHWTETAVKDAIIHDDLEGLLRANRRWLEPLKKIVPSLHSEWTARFAEEDRQAELGRISRNQPANPDAAYALTDD